jgi:hypothetical protein
MAEKLGHLLPKLVIIVSFISVVSVLATLHIYAYIFPLKLILFLEVLILLESHYLHTIVSPKSLVTL